MTTDELKQLAVQYPDAVRVWYDRMFDLSKGQLIETLLTYMTPNELLVFIQQIDNDIAESRNEENQHG